MLTGMTMQDETYRSVSSFCAASTLQSNRSELVDSSHFESHFESGDSGESLHLNARDTLSCSISMCQAVQDLVWVGIIIIVQATHALPSL